jgi:NAD(P)-dependent dehydrogenase (short-subunit alcohol dehydrogenase family)
MGPPDVRVGVAGGDQDRGGIVVGKGLPFCASGVIATRRRAARSPIGRMGTVTDIAKGIVFLASDDAAFMTGAGLVIDGGITAQ